MTNDEQAIREVVETWMAATRAGDTASILSLMTDDVVFMVPGQEPFGRELFEAAAATQSDQQIDGASEIVEIKVLGDGAYARTKIDLTVTPAGGAPVHRSGYTLTIFRREVDGRWRLARDANLVVKRG